MALTERLSPPPPTFTATRDAAHRLAVHVISPARRRVTPPFGEGDAALGFLRRRRAAIA